MRLRCVILLVLAGSALPGCGLISSFWPGRQEQAPVIKPAGVSADAQDQPDEADGAKVQASDNQPAPEPSTTTAPAVIVVELESPAPSNAPPPREPASKEDLGEIIADESMIQINDQFITVEQIVRAAAPRLEQLDRNLSVEMFRGQAATIINREIPAIVSQALVLPEAEKHLPQPYKDRIDRQIEDEHRRMITSAGGSSAKLNADLASKGLTAAELLDQSRKTLLVFEYIRYRLLPAVSISGKDLWDYYRKHEEEFSRPKRVQMQIIALPFNAFLPAGNATMQELMASTEAAKKQINEAAAALMSGEDFTAVAKRLSMGVKKRSGGIWPPMPIGSFMARKVETEAFKLEQGKVSGVIEDADGYYIVKARKIEPEMSVPFEQAQIMIEARLRSKQLQKLERDYFRRLESSATIVVPNSVIAHATELAIKRYRK